MSLLDHSRVTETADSQEPSAESKLLAEGDYRIGSSASSVVGKVDTFQGAARANEVISAMLERAKNAPVH